MRENQALRSTACSICGRLILPGERVHRFQDPERGGRRRAACPLCHREALERGWTRAGTEATEPSAPAA